MKFTWKMKKKPKGNMFYNFYYVINENETALHQISKKISELKKRILSPIHTKFTYVAGKKALQSLNIDENKINSIKHDLQVLGKSEGEIESEIKNTE